MTQRRAARWPIWLSRAHPKNGVLLPGDVSMEKNVRRVELGGVTVRLRNYADVDERFLASVFAESGLRSRELLLILDTKDDFGCKDNGARGKTTLSKLLDPRVPWKRGYDQNEGRTHYREVDRYSWPDKTIDVSEIGQWDVVVYIPGKSTSCWSEFKPYLAWVLAHELEHARIIRHDVEFHFCMSWLYDYNQSIFSGASIGSKWQKCWWFPWEVHCHKRGKDVAVSLFGEHVFEECIERRRARESQACTEVLDFVLGLVGDPYKGRVLEQIKEAVLAGYSKEARRAAHELWRKHRSCGCESARLFDLAKYVPHPSR